MLPSNVQTVIMALLAIVPGFLATSCWARAKTWRGRGADLPLILQSLAVSAVIQVVLAPLTLGWLYPERDHIERHPWHVLIWLVLVVLLVPVLGGTTIGRLSNLIFDPRSPWLRGGPQRLLAWLAPPAAPPSIWDWLFTSNVPDGCFVVVEFTDKSRVAGVFAKGSLALTSPEPQGVFLSREWSVDENGDLLEAIPGTAGILIPRSADVRVIRLLKGTANGEQQ